MSNIPPAQTHKDLSSECEILPERYVRSVTLHFASPIQSDDREDFVITHR